MFLVKRSLWVGGVYFDSFMEKSFREMLIKR